MSRVELQNGVRKKRLNCGAAPPRRAGRRFGTDGHPHKERRGVRRRAHAGWCGVAIACTLVLVRGGVVEAGLNAWTGNGPPGGDVSTLAIDPQNPSTLYAGTFAAGMFKSTDGGDRWDLVFPLFFLTSVAIDPVKPDTIYAGALESVFVSTNGGIDWKPIGTPEMTGAARAIAIGSATAPTLYVGTDCLYFNCREDTPHVFRSSDGGTTWERADAGIAGAHAIVALAVDPVDARIVYAGTEAAVFKSTDAGRSWMAASDGLPAADPTFFTVLTSLVIDPSDGRRLYAAVGASAFRSVDAGGRWEPINSGLDVPSISAVGVDPTDPRVIYASSDYAGFLTTEPGTTVYRSVDRGQSWQPTGLAGAFVRTLAFDPRHPGTVYAGSAGAGVLETIDAGASWSAKASGMTNTFVAALAVDPMHAATVYASGSSGLYRSDDGGAKWTPHSSPGYASVLVVDPSTPGVVYGGGYGVFKSIDGGENWSSLGLEHQLVLSLLVDPGDSNTLYAAGAGAVFKTTDGGGRWYPLARVDLPDSFFESLALDPLRPNVLFAAVGYCEVDTSQPDTCVGRTAVFSSTDGGESWMATTAGVFGVRVTVAVAPTTPATIFAATGGSGFFRSTDAGANWTPIRTDLPFDLVESIVVDADRPTTIYAGGNGVAKSVDGGASWYSLGDGLPSFVNVLALSPAEPALLYAGTDGRGVFALEQQPVCIGDCGAEQQVHVDDLVNLTRLALGAAAPPLCAPGIPGAAVVDAALVRQAVSNALRGCR